MASVYAFTSLQACVQSATLPAVTEYSDRHTGASTARCILELSTFCAAHILIAPSRTCGVWMHFNMACICHQPFKVRICDKNFEQHLPFTLIFPAAKPAMGVFTISIVWRKVSPGAPVRKIRNTALKRDDCHVLLRLVFLSDPRGGAPKAPILCPIVMPPMCWMHISSFLQENTQKFFLN